MRLFYSNLQLSILNDIYKERMISVEDALQYNQLTFGSLFRHKLLDYDAYMKKIHVTKEGRSVLNNYFSMAPLNKHKAPKLSRYANRGKIIAMRKSA